MRRARKLVFDKARGIYQPALTEEDVVAEIIQRLTWNQIKVYRIAERIPGMSKRLSTPGLPDLFVMVNGKVLFLEVKRRGGVRRPAQIRFMDEAKSEKVPAGFVECWTDVVRLFSENVIELK